MATMETKYGRIFYGGPCEDDYPNMELYHQRPDRVVKLQRPAIKSLKAAEERVGRDILLTGTGWRSCSLQAELYASDSNRYADPDVTLHTRGLAIDVSTEILNKKIKAALLDLGWHQVRPDDEPWHFSFRLTA